MNHEQKKEHNAESARRERSSARAAYAAAFAGTDGTFVLAHLHHSCGFGRPVFTPAAAGNLCPYAAAFRDGRRSVIDEIRANLPAAFLTTFDSSLAAEREEKPAS